MVLRLILGEVVTTVIWAYTPQVGLGVEEKGDFWDCLDAVVRAIHRKERIFIGGEFNGHIGKENDGFRSVYGGFGWGDRNDSRRDLLEFAIAHGLDVKAKIRDKKDSLRVLLRFTDEDERVRLRERYTVAKREGKKGVTEAKNIAYKRMYGRLETKEGEHDMFKIAKARERRRQDLQVVKFIKGEDERVLIKEHDIKLKWQTYFHNIFNNQRAHQQESENTTTQRQKQNTCYYRGIMQGEVKTTLRKMGRAKAVGPDNIPIEAWKCLGEEEIHWLTSLLNLIFKSGKCHINGGVVS
ncbi:uncharacterized protein LOC118488193 [Helianthus annuus]|uniref:uncharacterized protein LOC118488193 n=1 Tax=Helianthus annuus TaxID=4232 RepID=UPI00165306E3|nr:uncharacterized protein LOC118488193 [Helianthus annuus]